MTKGFNRSKTEVSRMGDNKEYSTLLSYRLMARILFVTQNKLEVDKERKIFMSMCRKWVTIIIADDKQAEYQKLLDSLEND